MPLSARVLQYRNPARDRSERDERENEARRSYENEVVRQLDVLQQAVTTERERVWKKGWEVEIERFYNLTESLSPAPSFRPKVLIPECQTDMLHEASDLSDVSPIPYIIQKGLDDRQLTREKAFQAQWKQSDYNLEFLKATIWSLFAGNGYLRVAWDADACNGEGEVVVCSYNPAHVYRDPYAMKDRDIKYVIFDDEMYLDDVRARWPENGWRIKYHRGGASSSTRNKLSMPEGPMTITATGGPIGMDSAVRPFASSDSRVIVRTAWVDDQSSKLVRKPRSVSDPKWEMVYPNGRMIIECEGVILYDGGNPIPGKIKPIVTIWGTPPLFSAFAPAPIKYSKDLQELAERGYTQNYENAVRLNNGVWFIDEGTGIDLEDFGGVPAEAHMITSQSRIPECRWPQPMPAHMMELPKVLLEKAEKVRGFTPSRRGITAAGNVSAPLNDASILQSQSLTRMRAKFLANSFQRLAQIVFAMMGRFYLTKRTFPVFNEDKYEPVDWEAIPDFDPANWHIKIDENSIRPYSQTALRSMVPVMKQLGIIDPETAMDLLDVPNKEVVLQRLREQASQAAQAKQQEAAAKAAAKGKK